jgi:hypothetical protein
MHPGLWTLTFDGTNSMDEPVTSRLAGDSGGTPKVSHAARFPDNFMPGFSWQPGSHLRPRRLSGTEMRRPCSPRTSGDGPDNAEGAEICAAELVSAMA